MKFKKIFAAAAACLMLATALTGCASYDEEAAKTDSKNITFTATPSKKNIKVETEKGTQKLEIIIEPGTYDPSKMILDDYNFDGYTDIAFPVNYNEHNSIYQLFLYNAENGQFEKYAGFSDHYSPELDKENKKILTTKKSDPVSTATGVFEWRDGKMICLEMVSITQDGEGNEITIRMEYNEETGELELVSNETKPLK